MPFKVIMPNLRATSESSTLLKWLVKEGDLVKIGDPLFEAESDKAVMEVESAAHGKIVKLLAPAGDVIPAGQQVAWILEPGETLSRPFEDELPVHTEIGSTPAPSPAPDKPAGLNQRMVITPVARRLARTEGVDISLIKGSGPRGRIVLEDVSAIIEARSQTKDIMAPAPLSQDPSRMNTPLTATRKTIAHRMADSAKTAARVTLTSEAGADELVSLRSRLQNAAGVADGKISYDLLLAWIVLGIGRIRKQPVERNGQLALGQVISLSLSFDHRIVDGVPAARFLQRITDLIEASDILLLYLNLGKSMISRYGVDDQ